MDCKHRNQKTHGILRGGHVDEMICKEDRVQASRSIRQLRSTQERE